MSQQLITRAELFKWVENPEEAFKNDHLNSFLNQPPHNDWIKANGDLKYLPIDKVELMLTYIFQNWKVEILREGLILNSLFCTIRLHVQNKLTSEWYYRDGIGAVPVQLDKSTSEDPVRASDMSRLKAMAVQMNLPSAYSYAISNAAARLGAIFGRDLNRKDTINFIGGFTPPAETTEKPVETTQATTIPPVQKTIDLTNIPEQTVKIEL